MPNLATNKLARFNYQIMDEYEAGLVLNGAEVKSVKKKQLSLKGAYIAYDKGELWLKHCHITPYQMNNQRDYNPDKIRKILMKRSEIDSLMGKMKSQGLTLLPINLYTKGALIKIKVGLARGKKQHDKRAAIKKRDSDRNISRALKARTRG